MLCSLCERVCWRARKRGLKARTVTLKLRYTDFQTLSRSRTIAATCSELDLYPVVREIFARARRRSLAIRLLGIALHNLVPDDGQLRLFGCRDESRNRAVDGVRRRYDYDAIRSGLTYDRPRRERSEDWSRGKP